jgi:hypothetical protein
LWPFKPLAEPHKEIRSRPGHSAGLYRARSFVSCDGSCSLSVYNRTSWVHLGLGHLEGSVPPCGLCLTNDPCTDSTSHQVFRSQHAPVPELHQDVARFFGAGPSPAPQMAVPQSFNLSSFHDALPTASPVPVQSPQLQSVPSAAWAADFLTQQQQRPRVQAVQAKNVEMQQDRIQSPPSSIGGMQSACLSNTQYFWVVHLS